MMFFNEVICVSIKDIDFPCVKRLNNGYYLMLAANGIYLYNPNLTSKIDILIFGERRMQYNYHSYSSNIAQFLNEDDGYIIGLILNTTYIISKDGKYLTQYTLDYIKHKKLPIIAYGHSNYEYYYFIIEIEVGELIFKNYIYNSEKNSVYYDNSYKFSIGTDKFNCTDCQLMYYLNSKVIICFYGNWITTFYKVFNISNFSSITEISELQGEVQNAGGQFFKSAVTNDRNKVGSCSQHVGDLVCFVYDIDSNNHTDSIIIVNENVCDTEPIDMLIGYFPETEKFIFACILHVDVFLGIFSLDNEYNLYNATGLIDSNIYGIPNKVNLVYSKNQKYAILTDADEKTLFEIDLIESNKINDFPSIGSGPLICDNYYSYNKTYCIDTVPDCYYCNSSYYKTIENCHENCLTCNKGPTNKNHNCITCKTSKFYDLGNCVDKCPYGYFIDIDNFSKCKCTNDIKCHKCIEESLENNLCLSCNNDKGYYQKFEDKERNATFINCYKNLEGYYLDNDVYKKCFDTCKTCKELGDNNNHKCLECRNNYEFKNYLGVRQNCYEKCDNYYYFDSLNKYHCIDICPNEYNKLIYNKKECIDKCENDQIYKYEYENLCYEKCPLNTKPSTSNNYLCEKIDEENTKCEIIKRELNDSIKEISINDINKLTKEFFLDSIATNNTIIEYSNNNISIYIYKNNSCLETTSSSAPKVNFGTCNEKLKEEYNISEDLITSVININIKENSRPLTTYTFSNPKTGDILNSSEICSNDTIVIEEDIKSLLSNIGITKEEFIIPLTKQGIDIFNILSPFYTDLCYHFESPNGKDIPLKDRISVFFHNITLCDKGCENLGVNLKTLKAKCGCIFNDLMSSSLVQSNIYGQYVEEFLTLLNTVNISVLKCIKDIFNKKYFINCYGAYIFIFFFFCQLSCIITFFIDKVENIKKYFSSLVESYINYTSVNKNNEKEFGDSNLKKFVKENFPPKKKEKTKSISKIQNNSYQTNNILILSNSRKKSYSKEGLGLSSKILKKIKSKKIKSHSIQINNLEKKKPFYETKNNDINIKEYLSTSFDETDFDDVLEKEKRNFFTYFMIKIRQNQMLINAFFLKEPLKPKPLKFLLIIMTFELYFIINALFYTEDYLSELFNSNKKERFFDFVGRRINYFIYTSAVSKIITYLVEYCFIEEKKIKKILLRNKEEKIGIVNELTLVIENIEKRFIILIILSIIINIFGFIYISCFNIVYYYIKIEWIKSTIFILICMEIIDVFFSFIETCLRFLSIKCNSEKLFKLSLFFG